MKTHKSYCPTDDEEYMNQRQLKYFENELKLRKRNLLSASSAAKKELQQTFIKAPDIFDVAFQTTELAVEVKDIERTQQKLISIDKALAKINTGDYGYCELTGEEIGIKRLQVQPTATLSIEGQELLERNVRMKGHNRGPVRQF